MNLFAPLDSTPKQSAANDPAEQVKPKQRKEVKTIDNPASVFEAISVYLTATEIPPFTEFRCKGVAPNVFKWFIDTIITSTKPVISTDKLVIHIQIERQGQNPDDPNAKYFEFVELHRRTLTPPNTPKAIGQKPRKKRAAKGSRTATTTITDSTK